ncbi:MAG: hypothetical protein HND48_14765 [Chloroflexi bacterium]|nr:hypothetical protein [Chloroflexota bacterium]
MRDLRAVAQRRQRLIGDLRSRLNGRRAGVVAHAEIATCQRRHQQQAEE